jgi:hypothetical protein
MLKRGISPLIDNPNSMSNSRSVGHVILGGGEYNYDVLGQRCQVEYFIFKTSIHIIRQHIANLACGQGEPFDQS